MVRRDVLDYQSVRGVCNIITTTLADAITQQASLQQIRAYVKTTQKAFGLVPTLPERSKDKHYQINGSNLAILWGNDLI